MKEKTLYVCGECGYETPRWMGKCPQCGSWNTLVEEERVLSHAAAQITTKAVPLQNVRAEAQTRISTGIGELDRVLGGGLVKGMVVLLGGDPGIGKSTLLLEAADNLSASGPVLYVSGEESNSQIKLRADRLGVKGENLYLYTETSAEAAIERAKETKAQMLIVDSIQTMESEAAESAAGSISQVRAATALFTRFAKDTGTVVWIVGHVTKDGAIAGPRVLEHIVDTVLYFEGDRHEGLRLLRAVKNRFGSTNELGVFEMCETGMREVKDPGALFVSGRNVAGTAITCVLEGSRPLICEIQSLLCPSAFQSPRRTAVGLDVNRLNVILAVLERKARLRVSDKDVYCDVAGSLRIVDRGADLATAMCVASSILEKPLPEKTVLIGEVGLTGEIRAASQLDTRVKEAVRLGYTTVLVPARAKIADPGCRLVRVGDISEAIRALFMD
ncbi:MAG: DNA repair protein RadA [Clostridia bacterium]|nr:DNA repair protein RadA [Clostridia bacterium]MBR0508183.1 DNA repair protein RadA [Clostridia bacterium]